MNSADLFAFAISGAQTENSINSYANSFNQSIANAGELSGWLKDKVGELQKSFTGFVNSRLWEYSARLLGHGKGEFVGRFDVGYLGTVTGLQSAEGLMQNYIMANPTIMKLYQEDLIEGYGGKFDPLCTGIGRDNYYYRQAPDGVIRKEVIEDKNQWLRTDFNDSIGGPLSFREKVNVHKTWAAADAHTANTYLDITSTLCNNRKDHLDKQEESEDLI